METRYGQEVDILDLSIDPQPDILTTTSFQSRSALMVCIRNDQHLLLLNY